MCNFRMLASINRVVILCLLTLFSQGCKEAVVSQAGIILKVIPEPSTQNKLMMVYDKLPISGITGNTGPTVLRYFTPSSNSYTDLAQYSYDTLTDMTLDYKRNQALIANGLALHRIDLATGTESTVSDRNIGNGPLYWAKFILYDEITDSVVALYGDPNIVNVLYRIDLVSGDRTEIAVFNHYIRRIDIDATGRRLFVLYENGYYDLGLLSYNLETGNQTILFDTLDKIGDYLSVADYFNDAFISYSAKHNELFLISHNILGLNLATGDIREVNSESIKNMVPKARIDDANTIRGAYVADDGVYLNISRDISLITSTDEPSASYLFRYDLLTSQLINLEKTRWDIEDSYLRGAINNTFLDIFQCIFGTSEYC